jgi:hypothetical protein
MVNLLERKQIYAEKLKNPRWQKKRLKILERDGWACQKCFDNESTLVVHHRLYLTRTEPWDYPDELLITLCEDCHENETNSVDSICKTLVNEVRSNFLSSDIIDLSLGFHELKLQHSPGVVASVYGWALSESNIQSQLIEQYFKILDKKLKERTNGQSSA